jgi:hypothetical protein
MARRLVLVSLSDDDRERASVGGAPMGAHRLDRIGLVHEHVAGIGMELHAELRRQSV